MFGQIDYIIDKAENGWWQLDRTFHVNPVPGDNEPEHEHVGERRTKQEVVDTAIKLALTDLEYKSAEAVTIFVDGNEVWCKGV